MTSAQEKIISESDQKTLNYAKYEAAKEKFNQIRRELIKRILLIKLKEGENFLNAMNQQIQEFKEKPILSRLAASVRTGESLEDIMNEHYLNQTEITPDKNKDKSLVKKENIKENAYENHV